MFNKIRICDLNMAYLKELDMEVMCPVSDIVLADEESKYLWDYFEKSKLEITEKMKLKQITNNRPKYCSNIN